MNIEKGYRYKVQILAATATVHLSFLELIE